MGRPAIGTGTAKAIASDNRMGLMVASGLDLEMDCQRLSGSDSAEASHSGGTCHSRGNCCEVAYGQPTIVVSGASALETSDSPSPTPTRP